MKVFVNQFCRDTEGQMQFYATLLGLPELAQRRSPIYRALDAGEAELGFNSEAAYALLSLDHRMPAEAAPAPVTAYATFMLDSPQAVDAAAAQVQALGGGVIKPPYATYYQEWQAVLHDPEQRVFRVSAAVAAAPATPAMAGG
jgi:hypothetical protein